MFRPIRIDDDGRVHAMFATLNQIIETSSLLLVQIAVHFR